MTPAPQAIRTRASAWQMRVPGTPAPQGSKRHVGNGILVESSKKVAPWREAIVGEAQRTGLAGIMLDDAVAIDITFELPRPNGHYRTGRNSALVRESAPAYPSGKPDLDKLIRSVLDGLVQAGMLRDDSLVVSVQGRKRYAGKGQHPGALITVGLLSSTSAPRADAQEALR